jgi:tetratricopeptide (TPR) repeat protein
MKKVFLFLIFSLSIVRISAQAPQVDSLKKLLASTREDTVKVMALVNLGFYDQSFQHGLDLAQEGLALARKIKYEKGEAACLHQIANQYSSISNYPVAIHYYLTALKIRERINDKREIPDSYFCIGFIYQEQGDYKNAINYYQKAEDMHIADNYRLALINSGFGDVYELLNNQNLALKYYQSSYEYFNLCNDKYQLNLTLNGLGSLQFNMRHNELAMGYFREAIRNGISYNDTVGLSFTYLRIAKLYDAVGAMDSSIFYAGLSMFCSQRAGNLQNVIESGKLLSKLYENKNEREALRCLKISLAAKDSLFSRERTMQIQNMFLNETERESEIAEKVKKDSEDRSLNIQYALIALSIVVFIILFLLLSRSIIVNEKWISFFGVLGLLVVFEFINLLMHPWLLEATHASPIRMLLALVAIASFLIPFHHRMEKWIKEKMTEKNKRIRLSNAKRTIEKLEEKTESL